MNVFSGFFSQATQRFRITWQLRGKSEARLHSEDARDPLAAAALGQALRTNLVLTKLWLSQCDIGDEAAAAVAKGLRENRSLRLLDLGENDISDAGVVALAEAVSDNTSIAELRLQGNSVGDDGAEALATMLKKNRTLTSLELDSNQIADRGAIALADALGSNESLARLLLGQNRVAADGEAALADVLRGGNSTLLTLSLLTWLSRTGVERDDPLPASEEIGALLKRNMRIKEDLRRTFRLSVHAFLSTLLLGVKLASPEAALSNFDEGVLRLIASFAGVPYRGVVSRWRAAQLKQRTAQMETTTAAAIRRRRQSWRQSEAAQRQQTAPS